MVPLFLHLLRPNRSFGAWREFVKEAPAQALRQRHDDRRQLQVRVVRGSDSVDWWRSSGRASGELAQSVEVSLGLDLADLEEFRLKVVGPLASSATVERTAFAGYVGAFHVGLNRLARGASGGVQRLVMVSEWG